MGNDNLEIYSRSQTPSTANKGDAELGGLKQLPGKWINAREGSETGFEGRGWNMIALPFEKSDGSRPHYRMLVNQYNEVLEFSTKIGPVPNRGIDLNTATNTDQEIFALDYQQAINQIKVADFPETDDSIRFPEGAGIHHEPGFFLSIVNELTDGLDIARAATIPHGDSVLAMGRSSQFNGKPTIPVIDSLPIGAVTDLTNPYLAPYAAFAGANKFLGLFDVAAPHELLQAGIDLVDSQFGIKSTTELHFDTKFSTGGIVNIPFVVKQANATEMVSIFWVMELETPGDGPKWAISYAQIVMLEFFSRFDQTPGLIKWPHVSINTMMFDEQPPQELRMKTPYVGS